MELVAAKEIGQETVAYVANIYKYYVAYKLAVQQRDLWQKATGLPASLRETREPAALQPGWFEED